MSRRQRKSPLSLAGLLLAGGLILSASGQSALAEKRVALVIGNSAYQNAPALPNPTKDANLIKDALTKAKFDVVNVQSNVGYLDFKRALQKFQDAAADSDIALIYYAGHGIQVGQMNYLIPVDARLATEVAAKDETVSLERMIEALEPARKLRLIILDACRDNPFAKTMKRATVARSTSRSAGAGLAQLEPTIGDSLIAYAAKAGSTAEDGEGENSPFAKALANNLFVEGLDIRLAFGRVRDEVLKATDRRQDPFVTGAIGGGIISLNPAPEAPKQDIAAVRVDYELVEKVGSAGAWQIFIDTHRTGLYVELAKEQLKKLAKLDPPTSTPPAAARPATPPPAAQPTTPDQRAWEQIKDSSDSAKVRDFIKRYPRSPLTGTAQDRLAALEQPPVQDREDNARVERESKTAAAERVRLEQACKRDQEQLATLRNAGTQGWVREDLKRLDRELVCERLRSDVVAALEKFGERPSVSESNTAVLVRTAQQELKRVGCFPGAADGNLNDATRTAVSRYLSERGQPAKDGNITEAFVADLKQQSRICPLQCATGQVASGERCIAAVKPETPAATARQSDDAAARPQKSRPKETQKEARTKSNSNKTENKSRTDSSSSGTQSTRVGTTFGTGVGF